MKLLIIDTSAMLFGFSNGNNVFEMAEREVPGHKLLVSEGLINELSSISKNKGAKGMSARLALSILKSKKINILIDKQIVDDWILYCAKKHRGLAVITNDSALANRLKKAGAGVYKLSRSGILQLR